MTTTRYWLTAGLLLAGLAAIQTWSALNESATMDEPTHLAAGVSYWQTGDFRLNPEHPSLVKFLSAIPPLMAGAQSPITDPSWQTADDYRFGSIFLYLNSLKPETLLFLGRLPIILLSIAFGLCLFIWTKRRYGGLAGLAVTAAYVFDPSVQAHGHLVTTDLAAAFAFFGVIVVLDWYLKTPTIKRGWMLAIVFAVAQLIKFSLVVLWLIVPLVFLLRWWYDRRVPPPLRPSEQLGASRGAAPAPPKLVREQSKLTILWSWKKLFGLIGQMFITLFVMAFIVYGGELKKPMADPNIATLYQKRAEIEAAPDFNKLSALNQSIIKLTDPQTESGQRIQTWLNRIRIPAYSYLSGLAAVIGHNHTGHGAYLLGENSSSGWWYYFPVAWLVKTPLGILMLILIGAVWWLRDFIIRNGWKLNSFDPILLTVPVLIYLFFALISNLNLGIRHLLPIAPFGFGLAAFALVKVWQGRSIILHWAAGGLFAFGLLAPLRNLPHPITYYSELIGGTRNGHQFVMDSNLDWGQSVAEASRYIKKNSIQLSGATLFYPDDLGYYGLPRQTVPTDADVGRNGIQPGNYLISVQLIKGAGHEYQWLEDRKPERVFGGVVYLYRVD